MVPVSMNGFGVREATFGFYFTRLGLPLESALLVSFIGAALVMLFSLSGGVVYLARLRSPPCRSVPLPAQLDDGLRWADSQPTRVGERLRHASSCARH